MSITLPTWCGVSRKRNKQFRHAHRDFPRGCAARYRRRPEKSCLVSSLTMLPAEAATFHFAQCRRAQHHRSASHAAISSGTKRSCHPGHAEPANLPLSAVRSGGQLCGRRSGPHGTMDLIRPSQSPQALAFSGVHVISPRLLPMFTEDGVFSIIDAYLRLAAQGEKILAFRADAYYWRDLGKPGDLAQAAEDIQRGVLSLWSPRPR